MTRHSCRPSIVLFIIMSMCGLRLSAQQMPSFRGASGAMQSSIVAVYADSGAWFDGITAFEHFLDWKGIAHERVTRDEVNRTDLRTRFAAIYFPGGYSGDYSSAITAVGARHIKDLVNDGGGYIGICAGAYYAAKTIAWEGSTFAGELDLFDGTATGSLTSIKPWPGYGMTTISLNPNNPIARGQRSSMTTMYFGGPSFRVNAGASMDTIATWDQANNLPAIITTRYGAGRVLLIGPHPEIEENDARDGSLFGSELRDPESEWGLLWSAMDWLLNRPITDTLATGMDAQHDASPDLSVSLQSNYPNPFAAMTSIRYSVHPSAANISALCITITDLLGRRIASFDAANTTPGVHAIDWEAGEVPPGVYRVILTADGVIQSRMIVHAQ
jgi:glutamine amidotransferase-like uncharacterized protein